MSRPDADEPREDRPPDPRTEVERALAEFGRRLLAGERPEPSRFAEQYPDEWRESVEERCAEFLRLWDVVSAGRPRTDAGERPGARFGDYRIIAELGRGGMGIVYLAWDERLERSVALKVLPAAAASDPRARKRFEQEARAAARLEHPGIVSVHASGEADGTLYIAMEYVAGRTLEQMLGTLRNGTGGDEEPAFERGPGGTPAPRHVARLVAEVADALQFAHDAGVIHRDVKPHNVIVSTAGRARLVDFGLAKVLDADSISSRGELAGTYFYMSPEQALAKNVRIDHRTDVFSAGVTLYELLTLRRPFTGKSPQEVLYQISFEEATPVRRLDRRVPRDLAVICAKAMEKRPDDRYQTAAELAVDVRRFLDGRPILATPPTLRRRFSRAAQRHRRVLAAAGASALLAGGAAFAFLVEDDRPRLSVRCAEAGARVALRPIDASSFAVGEPRPLGAAPVLDRRVEPGLYRVVVEVDGLGFGEVTAHLRPGRESVKLDVPVRATEAVTGDDMVPLAGGPFRFGQAGTSGGLAEREADVEGFWLDRGEVTNAEYRAFVLATGHREPLLWRDGYREAWDGKPVAGVSAADAAAYAAWAGKRLPTILEWERAARGVEGRRWPWSGDPPEGGDCATWLDAPLQWSEVGEAIEQYDRWVRPADGCLQLDSPEGVHHLYGNVHEWTDSLHLSAEADGGAPVPGAHYYKGASFRIPPEKWPMSFSAWYAGDELPLDIGFRCAKSQRP